MTFANLCKPIHDIMNYSSFICLFKFGKSGKEGKQSQKFEYQKRIELFRANQKHVSYVVSGYHLVKKIKK